MYNEGMGKLNIDDTQFGKKVGKHAQDYGLSPADPIARNILKNYINDIFSKASEIRQGEWMGLGEKLPNGLNGPGLAKFYIKGNDVVITDMSGNFVTLLKDGVNNLRVKNAVKTWP